MNLVWWWLFVSTLAAIESLVKLDAVVKSKYGLLAQLPKKLLEVPQRGATSIPPVSYVAVSDPGVSQCGSHVS